MSRYDILAVDQGLASIGYAVVRVEDGCSAKVIVSGSFETKPHQLIQKRIQNIMDVLEDVIREGKEKGCRFAILATEDLFVGPVCARSVFIVGTNMVTGGLMLLAEKHGMVVYQLAPTSVKKRVTGDGKAEKEDVEEAVQKLSDFRIRDGQKIKDHQTDAIAIGIAVGMDALSIGLDGMKDKLETPKTRKKKKASKKVLRSSDTGEVSEIQ